MNKALTILASIILVSFTFISCADKGKNSQSNDPGIEKTMSQISENTYDPGSEWKLSWSDEFTEGNINSDNWNLQEVKAGRFNEEWQRYTNSDKNAYVEDDCLVIKAIHESDEHGMNQYTSARINTANKQSWKYGKIAAKIKLPYGKGIWPAFWMLGANIDENGGDTPWPQCGEIDILELYGSKDDGVVESNIHYANKSGSHTMMGAKSYELEDGRFTDDFHVFELVWDENTISWLVDGNQYATFDISSDELSEFHEDFFILLNLAVGGTYAGYPDDSSTFPQYMYIDWVRVYEKG